VSTERHDNVLVTVEQAARILRDTFGAHEGSAEATRRALASRRSGAEEVDRFWGAVAKLIDMGGEPGGER